MAERNNKTGWQALCLEKISAANASGKGFYNTLNKVEMAWYMSAFILH